MANYVYSTMFLKGNKSQVINLLNKGLANDKKELIQDGASLQEVLDTINKEELSINSFIPIPQTFLDWDTTNQMNTYLTWLVGNCDGAAPFSPALDMTDTYDKVNAYIKEHEDKFGEFDKRNGDTMDKAAIEVFPQYLDEYEKYVKGWLAAKKYQYETYGVVGWYSWRCHNYGCKWSAKLYDWRYEQENGDEVIIAANIETAWSEPLPFFATLNSMQDGVSVYAFGEEECRDFIYTYNPSESEYEATEPFGCDMFQELKAEEEKNHKDGDEEQDEWDIDYEITGKVTEKVFNEFLGAMFGWEFVESYK